MAKGTTRVSRFGACHQLAVAENPSISNTNHGSYLPPRSWCTGTWGQAGPRSLTHDPGRGHDAHGIKQMLPPATVGAARGAWPTPAER